MRHLGLLLSVIAALVLGACVAHADTLQNPGFETEDFSSWTQSLGGLTALVVDHWVGMSLTYGAPEGDDFAVLGAAPDADPEGSLYQLVNLIQGQTLKGVAAFDDHDPAYQGSWAQVGIAYVTPGGQGVTAYPWSASDGGAFGVGGPNYIYPGNSGPWTAWQFTAPETSLYSVSYTVSLVGGSTAYGLFDTVTPEPGTCALLLMGLPGLMYFRRRRSS